MIIGIDIGSTTTKAVSIKDGRVLGKIKTKAEDALTSAAGAFGKMLIENAIKLPEIERIMITGAGATMIDKDLFGIPTEKVDEISAIGIGGMFLSGRDNSVIINIGTGTAVIHAVKDKIVHLGGSGVGGGTILGLSKKLIGMSRFSDVMELAAQGTLNQVDLLIEDIMETDISFLHKDATASNFGKMLDTARNADIALGIINLVFQVIGMMAVFAGRSKNLDRVVVTGAGSHNPIGKKIMNIITQMHSIYFEFPEDAEYTTAIGAGLFRGNENYF
jgi:type II pantothenate kinase